MSNLPEELLEEIFYRVPAISVLRLRSTCKRWNNLFSTSRFARKHLHRPTTQRLALMLTSKKFKVCSMRDRHDGVPSIEVKGEINVDRFQTNLRKEKFKEVFHCDGLLLCTMREKNVKLLVWNPCTGQSRSIPRDPSASGDTYGYSLGSYQDDKSGNTRYKVLSYRGYNDKLRFATYEINSNSNKWEILRVTPGCHLNWNPVCLKGKTYWLAWDEKEKQRLIFVLSFDYTTDRFHRLLLPFKCNFLDRFGHVSLSSVREEKLWVSSTGYDTGVQDIWVTNKIDETKVVTWSKLLTVDRSEGMGWIDFLVDEEKKIILKCSARQGLVDRKANNTIFTYIFGEDNKVAQVDIIKHPTVLLWPIFLNYVPSLVQIEGVGG